MLIVFVNEIALNAFENRVHTIEHQKVPVWTKTKKLTEGTHVELHQCCRYYAVKWAVLTTELYCSRLYASVIKL